jgi:hypothetical protein
MKKGFAAGVDNVLRQNNISPRTRMSADSTDAVKMNKLYQKL